MKEIVTETKTALSAFPKIDDETQEEAINLLKSRLDDDALSDDEGVVLDHALEDAGVAREERIAIVDELTELN